MRSIIVITVGLTALLGACSQEGETSGQGSSVPPGGQVASTGSSAAGSVGAEVTKDQSHWTLPTDPYYGGQISALTSQAEETVVKNCMVKAGFSDYRVRMDASAPAPANLAGDGISVLFNETTAKQFGYRRAPDPRDLLEVETEASGGDLFNGKSNEFFDQLDICNLEGQAVVAGVSVDEFKASHQESAGSADAVQENPASIGSQLNRLAVDLNSPELSAAAASWRECMAPLGISDLPDRPWDAGSMGLPESLRDKWGWRPTGKPSADEIATASADAACRASSGWTDTLYQQEWDTRQAFVDAHRAELAPVLAEHQAEAARAREIIAKGGA
ncbi:hypothetical protein [uncultured Actinomyces sp.]|uniref:hypothetical protein n=1 Tax=uncultured Actinomyces sp. TaxID=249061 RepID=UPI0028E6C66E|nr:hypothetical protein [uncultured Actinomyces sp.]